MLTSVIKSSFPGKPSPRSNGEVQIQNSKKGNFNWDVGII